MEELITKKMFREYLNKKHDERVEKLCKKLHSLPKKFIEREVNTMEASGNKNQYRARTRKQGDYLYFQDREMFNHLFEEWKLELLKNGVSSYILNGDVKEVENV